MSLLIVVVAVILLVILAWIVVGLVFKLLWWALIGLLIGAIARAILPGRQEIGLIGTGLAGAAGALLGGILAHVFGFGSLLQWLLAVGVAAAVIFALEGRRPARL